MKLPVIRHLQRNNTVGELEQTVKVLESFSEYQGIKDEEMDVIGELITNLCGAVEVHKMIGSGVPERDAANNFVKKVLGSIDQ